MTDDDQAKIMAIIDKHQIPGDGSVMDEVAPELWEHIEGQVRKTVALELQRKAQGYQKDYYPQAHTRKAFMRAAEAVRADEETRTLEENRIKDGWRND